MAGKTGTAQVRVYHPGRACARRAPRMSAWTGSCATMALFIGFAPVERSANMPASASSSMARHGHPQVADGARRAAVLPAARSLGMPAAYPVPIRQRAPQTQASRAIAAARRRLMALVPMPPPSAPCRLADKLGEVNWGLVLLITHDRHAPASPCSIRWRAAISSPGRCAQIGAFHPGPDRPGGGRGDRHPGVDEPGLSGLWLCAAAADRGGCGGPCRPGRAALDLARAAGPAALRADEDRAGAGAGALSARQEHRGSLQAAAAGHRRWR